MTEYPFTRLQLFGSATSKPYETDGMGPRARSSYTNGSGESMRSNSTRNVWLWLREEDFPYRTSACSLSVISCCRLRDTCVNFVVKYEESVAERASILRSMR